jgi:tetratricopeptide (TPR) repeat protein
MYRLWPSIVLAIPLLAGDPLFELTGRIAPPEHALVSLFGATSPFQATTESESGGRYRFRNLRAGTYTIAVYEPGRGEARQTIEVGQGTADARRRATLNLRFGDADFVLNDVVRRRNTISTRQLVIPDAALNEYREAAKRLEKHEVDEAVKRLEHAVALAPQFADAWNNLGTIAYQSQQYERAEKCFRSALEQDPRAYEPLVNLGGVLINNRKLKEALQYNQDAILQRPRDALANSQLGLTYFSLGKLDAAEKYLEIARQLDPAHFSHPQLVLAEIHLRRGENRAAADALDDFVARHPDFPTAAKIREDIVKLRQ